MRSFIESIIAIVLIGGIFMGFMLLLRTGINHMNEFDLNERIESFQNDKTFICSTGFMGNQKLLVSKSGNWEIHKMRYFKKEEMLLEIRLCEIEDGSE